MNVLLAAALYFLNSLGWLALGYYIGRLSRPRRH
jgi:hypothetical protein